MISASKEFKKKLKNGASVVNYADLTLSNGAVLHLKPKDFMIGGCQIEDKTTDGKFGVGFTVGKTLSIKLENNDERFSRYDFYNSIINLYVAMQLDNGSIEKIRKGVYYTILPETPGDIIEISAVDGMYQLDKDYATSTTAYPATLQTIITDACLDCGIPIGFRQFDNMNYVVNQKPEKATYRQIVSWACQIAGYNARIDNDGYMQLIWYKTSLLNIYNYNGGSFNIYPHDTILDGGDFKNYNNGTIISGVAFTDEEPEHIFRIKTLDVHTDDVQITGVRVIGEDDATALFGEEGYLIEVKGNPFVNGKESQIANYLGSRMVGMVFRPFTAQVLNNPLYEPFEVIRVSDRKGNAYNSIINSVSYKIGGYTQISCEAEDPIRNGGTYYSESAAAVVEARRNAQKQITTYDKAVQQMNQLAMNSMGFHTTYEDQPDGSRIVYLHDKPELKDSKTIYKQTIDGFFISQDGGKSYTAGFDKNGNAVVNILHAIGIVCDWIRGGTLTLGGADNINGIFQVLDASGNVICKITKDGLISQTGNLNENIETLGSQITQNSENIKAEVKRAQGQEITLAAAISINSENIKLKVSQGDVSSQISQESDKISIESNRFSLTSDNLTIAEDGTITAKNGYFEGTIKSKNAEITGGYINITTASQTYDTISLNYGVSQTRISPGFFYEKESGGIVQITPGSGFSVGNGSSFSSSLKAASLSCSGLIISYSNKVTDISAEGAVFGGVINVLGSGESSISGDLNISKNLYVNGSIKSTIKFEYAVSIAGTGSLTLDTAATFTCNSAASFNSTLSIGAGFFVTSSGNLTTNGSIKATGMYESSFYKLAVQNDASISGGLDIKKTLTVDGNAELKGNTKIGDSASDTIGFFGGTGSGKKTVSTISSTTSATSSTNATKINEIINALKSYNLL